MSLPLPNTRFSRNSESGILGAYCYGFNGKDRESEFSTGAYDFGARIHDARLGRWLSVDKMFYKFAFSSPYFYSNNNPIFFIDPDGNEPIKPQAGTISGFVISMNNSPSKVGAAKGKEAEKALVRLGSTEWSWDQWRPVPAVTPYFNMDKDRYVYTENGGWIDMVHFLFYAGKAYEYRQIKEAAIKEENRLKNTPSNYWPQSNPTSCEEAKIDPIGEAMQDGYFQEWTDKLFAKNSAYSYEDLPSDYYGADFATNYFDPNSTLSLGEQISNYFEIQLKTTTAEKAPNYSKLPESEKPKDEAPSQVNYSVAPFIF